MKPVLVLSEDTLEFRLTPESAFDRQLVKIGKPYIASCTSHEEESDDETDRNVVPDHSCCILDAVR